MTRPSHHNTSSVAVTQDLRSPELDVILAAVEQQQVLADLVEDESLADGTPRRLQGPHVKNDHQKDQHSDRDNRVDGVDDETHCQRPEQTEECSVSGEVAKRRPTATGIRSTYISPDMPPAAGPIYHSNGHNMP